MSEINVCRICLADNKGEMYRLKSIKCRRFYEKLVNSKLEDGLPKTFCYICYALLSKSSRFSHMAQQSQLILTELKNGGHKINEATLSKIDRPKHTYSVTKPEVTELISIEIDIQPIDTLTDPDIHVKDEYSEVCLGEDIFVNYKDESYNNWNENSNDRNSKINDTNDNDNDRKDKIIDSEDLNYFMGQPCAVWIGEGTNNKNNKINDKINNRNYTINDDEELNNVTKQPCTIWIEEGSVTAKKRKMKEKETIKNQNQSNLKCYQNKKKIKKTKNDVNLNLDLTEQHKVDPLTTNAELTLSENDISTNDKSKDIIPPASDNDISKSDKPLKPLSQIQQLLWKQVTSLFDKETVLSFSQETKPSSSLEAESSFNNHKDSNFVELKQRNDRYFHCSVCDYKCLMPHTFAQHEEACKIRFERMINGDINDPSMIGYVCKTCPFRTLSRTQYNMHREKHKRQIFHKDKRKIDLLRKDQRKGKLYYCIRCDYKTVSVKKFKRHKNQHDSKINTYWCNICGFICHTVVDLRKHKKEHNFKYICDLCQYGFRTKTEIISHLKNHSIKEYSCSQCDFSCRGLGMLRKHSICVHKGLVFCNDCEFKCNTQKELSLHIREIHENKPIQTCKICDYKCALEKHMISHTWLRHEGAYKCYRCDFQTTKKRDLKLHLLSKHNEDKLYACKFCNYKTDTLNSLKIHSMIHTDEKTNICDVCNFKFRDKQSLRIHIQAKHTVSDTKLLCQYCGSIFKTEYHFRKHLVFHSNKIKSCSICGYKCSTNFKLKNHMTKHTGEKPFVCDHCGQRFSIKGNLRRHQLNNCALNTHPNE